MLALSQETEALAKRVAAAEKLSVEDAIRRALEDRARLSGLELQVRRPRDTSPEAIAARCGAIDRFVEEISAMPVRDARSPQEIMDDLNAL